MKGKNSQNQDEEDSDSTLSTPASSLADLDMTPKKAPPKKAPPKKAPPKKAPSKAASKAASKKQVLFEARMAEKLQKLTKKG
jgi:hypothetical protein